MTSKNRPLSSRGDGNQNSSEDCSSEEERAVISPGLIGAIFGCDDVLAAAAHEAAEREDRLTCLKELSSFLKSSGYESAALIIDVAISERISDLAKCANILFLDNGKIKDVW